MEFLKNQFNRIQQQLGGLTATQRMLAGALVVIMVMTLMWWGVFAGRTETEVLLDQPMQADEVANITARLESRGIPAKVVGDRIQVPTEKRYEALADLAFNQLMPADTKNGLDDILSKMSPFASNQTQSQMFLSAKQFVLGQIIQRFPRVSHASIIIDPSYERGLGGAEPTATVSIKLRSGEKADQRLVDAAADVVSGAVAHLDRSRVHVTIDGASYPVRKKGDASPAESADDWLAIVQRSERYHADKLKELFRNIEGAMVSVSVRPDLKHTETLQHEVDPKNKLQVPIRENNNTEEAINNRKDAGEPGVVSNGSLSLDGTGGGGEKNQTTTEKTETDFLSDYGKKDIKSINYGGNAEPASATVMIPRSYFVQTFKVGKKDEKDPDAALLDAYISSELTKMTQNVRTCLGLAADAVHVDAYTDLLPVAAAAPQAAGTAVGLLLTDHMKEIALGVLALMSLFMVSNIVKKGTPVPVMVTAPPAPAKAAPMTLSSGEESVGEVGEGNPFLDGMELDEDSVKAQQMLGQVGEMVDENPDAAANLVKRWLNRS